MRASHLKIIAAVAGLVLFQLGHHVLAADPGDSIITKPSQNPAVIRAQLDLARRAAQQTLDRLRTAPEAETPATLDQTIYASYRYISTGYVGVQGRLLHSRSKLGLDDPLLGMAVKGVEAAATHIRNARHLAPSFSPERPDVTERIIMRLEDTITALEQVLELI